MTSEHHRRRILRSLQLLILWLSVAQGFLHAPRFSSHCQSTFSNRHHKNIPAHENNNNALASLSYPTSPESQTLCLETLSITPEQYKQLQKLASLVVEWNERINLISRKDCSVSVVWERHILPSISIKAWKTDDNPLHTAKTSVDVGTGGGFPGLPLAIIYPDIDFVLLDSVGKKLTAVGDMADELGLDNVQTHHGRAEELTNVQFDVATGRSVSALPQFCTWMHHLVKPSTGNLLYWIGGEVPQTVLDLATSDTGIVDAWIPALADTCDKHVLQFGQAAVVRIAKESGIVLPNKKSSPHNNRKKKSTNRSNKSTASKQRTAKGAWDKDRAAPKQRGYEGFKRYDSTSKT